MRIEVAFEAYASAKLPGQRKFHDVRLPCTTWIELEEVPTGPAVLRMTRPDGSLLEFRSHAGGLIRPLEMAHGSRARKGGPPMQASRLVEIASTADGPFNPFVVDLGQRSWNDNGPNYWERRPRIDADQASYATVERSDVAACRAVVARNAAKLACVEGAIWLRSAEPLYVVGHRTYEDAMAGHSTAWVEIDDSGSAIKDIGKHFRVDDLVDVLSAILPCGNWDPEDPTTFADRFHNIVEVLDPTVLRHRYDQFPAMERDIRRTVRSVGQDLSDLPTPAIVEWTQVRDLLLSRPSGQALADAACRLAEALAAAGVGDNADLLREAAELWRLSPVAEPEQPAMGHSACS